jgi:Uma2 family endonuclease
VVLKLRWHDTTCKKPMTTPGPHPSTVWRDCLRQLFPAEQIMGMSAHAPDRPWTEAEFYAARDAAPPGERWELVDGEVLVTPSPNWVHQRIIGRLFVLLDAYVRPRRFGEVFASPLDVKLRPGLVLQPDLLVVPSGELRRRSDIVQRLILATEIVSPSSARFDRVKKRPHYQRHRVSEYWIVDDMSQTIERWTPSDERPEILSERVVWQPAGVAEPFELDLMQFFKDVAAED